ncbi:hypothetical protein [Actinoallomurus sp. NPDC052274]|uniref:hypothetical protein n=1 Tax=Actinoallomurus sp. NPDC052274 TaxID=3155420 RepID=UPI0034488F81
MESSPVQLDCPIKCLVLPTSIRASLERHTDDPTETVGDLLKLAEANRLGEIRNIGQGSIEWIEESLRRAGFPVPHRHAISHQHKSEPAHSHDPDAIQGGSTKAHLAHTDPPETNVEEYTAEFSHASRTQVVFFRSDSEEEDTLHRLALEALEPKVKNSVHAWTLELIWRNWDRAHPVYRRKRLIYR